MHSLVACPICYFCCFGFQIPRLTLKDFRSRGQPEHSYRLHELSSFYYRPFLVHNLNSCLPISEALYLSHLATLQSLSRLSSAMLLPCLYFTTTSLRMGGQTPCNRLLDRVNCRQPCQRINTHKSYQEITETRLPCLLFVAST